MIFSTLPFVIFLVLTLVFYFKIFTKKQWVILLISSLLFVGYLSIYAMIYVVILSFINFFIGNLLFSTSKKEIKNTLRTIGLIANIGSLFFFKYINFFIDNIDGLFNRLNLNTSIDNISIIIPIGISYYTFQSIGYIIDIHRGTYKPADNFGKFLVYMLYFPKILAGPIERFKRFSSQINTQKLFDIFLFKEGAIQMFWGFLKKLVIADRLVLLVNEVNNNVSDYSGLFLYISMFLQVFHLYCDFSGYTDIVLGISKMFGINLTDNFKRPLFAQNVAMFWQRWHISLSGWCNDYIFNRILINHIKWKKWAAVYGVFVTFFIIGIWHGGRWTYIILGILQGIAINYEFFTKRLRIRLVNKLSKKIVVLFSRLITFHFIGFTIMLFYSKSISNSIAFISNIFSPWDLHDFKKILAILNDIEIIIILVGITLVLLIDYAHENEIKVREEYLRNRNVRHVLVIMLFLIVIFLGNLQSTEFVYLNF